MQKNEYNKIAKNTIVLGSSQIIQIGVTFIRAKMIVILLGATGMGIYFLIVSALMLILQIVSLGIFQSGVREISVLNQQGKQEDIAKIRKIFLYISNISGIIGILSMIILSPILSYMLFDNQDNMWYFIEASGALYFMVLYNSYATIMQATQNLLLMSKATILGAISGLIVAICCLYFFKINGIIPSIIGGYIMFWLSFRYYEHKIFFSTTPKITKEEFTNQSRRIIKLGIILMISSLMISLFTFLLNSFISKYGSIKEVGFYQSAASIVLQGMLISNMILASDFFPRLSAVHFNNVEMERLIHQQINILIYIIISISTLIIVFAPVIVWLLLAPDFFIVVELIQIMSIALIYRVIWMIFSYTILAKGDKKNYFIFDAFIGNGINFIISIVGFYIGGIKGTAIAFVIGSAFMAIFMEITVKIKYNLKINKNIHYILFSATLIMIFLVLINRYTNHWICNILSTIICSTVCLLSIKEFNKKSGISNSIIKKIKKHFSNTNNIHF